jgi:CheY-like chemotaxis protein
MPEIWLAEDNPADVYLIKTALSEHGVAYSLRVASDGEEVLSLISQGDAGTGSSDLRLIILDLNLPRHDGIEILEKLQQTPWMAGIPVVVLTSSDSPGDRLTANRLGAVRYLRKPSSLDQFLSLGAVFKDVMTRAEGCATTG